MYQVAVQKEFVCSNMQSGAIGNTFGKNMTANS
jgi:hypothetical protein